MILLMLAAAIAAETPAPSAEAEALGLRLAQTSGLVSMVPMIVEKEIRELADEDTSLTTAERETLFRIGRDEGKAGADRLAVAMGHAYAAELSIGDLRILVEQNESAAAAKKRAADPKVIMGAMASLGQFDLKNSIATRMCADTGKLCKRK